MNAPQSQRAPFPLPLVLTLLAAVLLALCTVLGLHFYSQLHGASAGAAAFDEHLPPAAMLPQAAPEEPETASIELGEGVVHFYFATGSAELPEDAALALADVVKGIATGQRAIISGWHDASGDQAQNIALATARAEAVQSLFAELGVSAEHVELRRPEHPEGEGAEARRVDVWLE